MANPSEPPAPRPPQSPSRPYSPASPGTPPSEVSVGAAASPSAVAGHAPGTTVTEEPRVPGELALVGGGEWLEGCESFDSELLAASAGTEVLVLPTAAAYEHPERSIAAAASYFAGLGANVKPCMVLRRADAEDGAYAGLVRAARFIYLAGGSVLHLRSVLKGSAVWAALVETWRGGAVVAGSSAGAMVLGETMVDPRGGALTLGLGLLEQLAVLPHASSWSEEKTHRTVRLASPGLRIAAIDERTALLRSPSGHWRSAGGAQVTIWVDGARAGLEALETLGQGLA